MNDNEINVLLDHFVGGLDSTESACVTQKIKTHPQWSKTYKQLNRVFGSLNTIKEQDNQQSAPEGLANKTFQKILEQRKNLRGSSDFIAQKSSSSEQTVHSKSDKRIFSVKPSFLALSACAGFVLVFVLAAVTFNFRNAPTNNLNTNFVDKGSSSASSPFIAQPDSNACASFAVTGATQQPSSSFFFCSNSTSEPSALVSFDNKNFAVNSAEQLFNLTPISEDAASSNESVVTMACPDNVVVITSRPEVRPIIIVQPRFPGGDMKSFQDVFNQSDVNFVVPVNYQK